MKNRAKPRAAHFLYSGFTKPLVIMALLACVGLLGILLDRPTLKSDMTIWLFAKSHYDILLNGNPSLIQQYQHKTAQSVDVQLIVLKALDVRLLSMFLSKSSGMQMPDVVEIVIDSMGKFFRPPTQDVGFYPLNDLIAQLPPAQHLLPSRLAPWTKDGIIFGIPDDVHPVAILYRKDLFTQAGIDLPQAKTWPQFQNLCLKAQVYWASHAHPEYRSLELRSAQPDQLLCMLMQRHINPLDDHNIVHLADPKVAQTMAFYAQLVAGPRGIGAETPSAEMMWTRSLASGQVCAAMCADWRIAELKAYAPELAGKVALMAMPKFDPTDAPTATWGGTMVGIPRQAKDPLASWKMIQFLYLSPESNQARRQYTHILPATPADWENPDYHNPDSFFANQKVDELYIGLARQLPERFITPFTLLAQQQLAVVMNQAINIVRQRGSQGIETQCQQRLNDAAVDLQRRVDFGKFEN